MNEEDRELIRELIKEIRNLSVDIILPRQGIYPTLNKCNGCGVYYTGIYHVCYGQYPYGMIPGKKYF